MSIPPVGPPPPPTPPPSGPSSPLTYAPLETQTDFFSPLRQVGSTISANEITLRSQHGGAAMSLMEFVKIIGENNQGYRQEQNLADLLDAFLQKLLKGNGALTAEELNQILAQITDQQTQTALTNISQNSAVTQMNSAIDGYNAGLLAEIAAVDVLNQAIDNYNNPMSVDYGNEAVLDAAVIAYNSYAASRAAAINSYNLAVDSYNAQVALNNAAIDLLNDFRTANGLPLLPHQATIPYRDPMPPAPEKSGGHYDAPGDIVNLPSRDPTPFGNHLIAHLDPVVLQITNTILQQLYDPIANPAFDRLNDLNLMLRYADEYRELKKTKINPTVMQSPDQIEEKETTQTLSAPGEVGGGGLLTLGNSLSNPNLQRIMSGAIQDAGTIGFQISQDIFNKVELLSKFLLTGVALQAATGSAFATLGNHLGQSVLSPTVIDLVLAQAVAQRTGALVASGIINSNIGQLLAGDASFQKLSPQQQQVLINNLSAAVGLSLLGLAFNQLAFALGAPGLPGQLLGSAFAAAGVPPVAAATPSGAIDLTQIANPLIVALINQGVDAATAQRIAAQLVALIRADSALSTATGVSENVWNALSILLSQALEANGVNAQASGLLTNVLGTSTLTSPEAAVRQGISKTLMRALYLPRDTALMIASGVPSSWVTSPGNFEAALARGTIAIVGTAVNAGQAIAAAGSAVGVALATPGALDSEVAFKQALASSLAASLNLSDAQAQVIVAGANISDLVNKDALRSSLRQEFIRNGALQKDAVVMAQVASDYLLSSIREERIVLDAGLRSRILEGSVISNRVVEDVIARNQIADDTVAAIENDQQRFYTQSQALAATNQIAGSEQASSAAVAAAVAAATLPPESPLINTTQTQLLNADLLANQLSALIYNQLEPALGRNKALLIAQAFIADLPLRELRNKNERDNPVSLLNLTIDQVNTLIKREDITNYRTFVDERLHDFIKDNTMMDYGAYLKSRLLNINGRTFLDTIHEAMGSQGGGVDTGQVKKSTDIMV